MERIRELIELDLDALRNTSFFGVYDGDGGAEVAMYCAKRFHAMLCEDENYLNNLPNAITSVCSRLDDDLQRSNEWKESLYPRGNGECFQFLKTGVCANLWHSEELGFMLPQQAYRAPLYEGSTACVVIIRGNQITVGNVGDSRCVVSHNGQAIDLSIDHKPTVGSERERILRAGERVLVKRIPVMGSDGRLMRGWGYFELKKNQNIPASQQMVTCDPEFTIVDITADTEFLVIATDGIWGHMSSQDVVDFIRKELHSGEENLRAICEKLLDHCLTSRDNVTVILVRFKPGAAVIPILSDIDEEPVLSDVEEEPHEPQQNPGDGGGGGGGQQDIGGESEELPLAHFPQEYSNSSAPLPMFDSFSGGGTPPIDTDTFLRGSAPSARCLRLHRHRKLRSHRRHRTPPVPLTPTAASSPSTEPLPLPEGGDHPVPPKKKIKVAPLLPERADQPVVTSNSATTTRPQLCAPYDDEIEATLRAMETNPAERPSPYFLETTQGGRMTALVRASMIAFMDEFSRFHELADGTLQRAAYFLDRYLSDLAELTGYKAIDLMGCVCDMYISNSPSPCANPGHYIALVTLRVAEEMRPPPPPPARAEQHGTGTVRVTRVKLLKPRDTLLLGQAYRLITVDEVTRVLQAKKEEKSRRAAAQHHLESKPAGAAGVGINSSGDDHTRPIRPAHFLSVSNSPSPCANPGNYIALVTLRVAEEMRPPLPPPARAERHGTGTVWVTRVKLLKPRDTLLLGQAYRLITVAHAARRW
uniref:protein-serine/threonine phosphatase n=1 Tax=Oryza rufipogon TaxID=4529 RepID=A0A0E0NHK0_ORYRU